MNKNTVKLAALFCILGLLFIGKAHAQDDDRKLENRQPPSVDEILETMDADKDGLLSKEEVKGPLKNDFDKIDSNEDGFLSKEELEKAPKPNGHKER